ncbi:hypothetical protein BDR26DRAFT_891743 [Obelidium mucronatum]|nr:hypothetical protein BDR26DRAFT_891743 [Obelidium mucronatum]
MPPADAARKGRKPADAPAATKRQNQKREAARAFRERQRRHLDALEAQVAALRDRERIENAALKMRLAQLELENRQLRDATLVFGNGQSQLASPSGSPQVNLNLLFQTQLEQNNQLLQLLSDSTAPSTTATSATSASTVDSLDFVLFGNQ